MPDYLFEKFKRLNLVHSLLLLSSMLGLLSVVGYLLGGLSGLVIALIFGVTTTLFTPKLPPRLLLAMYRAQPLTRAQAPELYNMLGFIVDRTDLRSFPTLYYLPSSVMNSFTLGSGEQASIVLSDGLLRQLNTRELLGVIAHEVSHLINRDLWVMGMADVISRVTSLLAIFGFFLLILYAPLMLISEHGFPWLLVIILMLAPNLSALMQLALSRTREFDADQLAASLTGDALGLASALSKIEQKQGSWIKRVLMPNYRVSEPSLLRTHPASEERIRRLHAIGIEGFQYENHHEEHVPGHLHSVSPGQPRRRRFGLWY